MLFPQKLKIFSKPQLFDLRCNNQNVYLIRFMYSVGKKIFKNDKIFFTKKSNVKYSDND